MIENIWLYVYYNYIDIISSPFWHPTIMLITYVFTATIYLIIDYFKFFTNMKIQKNKYVTNNEIIISIKEYIITEFLVYAPIPFVFNSLGIENKIDKFLPPLVNIIFNIFFIIMLIDLGLYITHYYLHKNKFLYKYIHSVHHKYKTSFSFATSGFHPIEGLLLGIVTVIPIYMFSIHWVVQQIVTSFIISYSVIVHSGYDSGIHIMSKRILGMEPFHDSHHKYGNKNFANILTIWDRFFDTYTDPYSLK